MNVNLCVPGYCLKLTEVKSIRVVAKESQSLPNSFSCVYTPRGILINELHRLSGEMAEQCLSRLLELKWCSKDEHDLIQESLKDVSGMPDILEGT